MPIYTPNSDLQNVTILDFVSNAQTVTQGSMPFLPRPTRGMQQTFLYTHQTATVVIDNNQQRQVRAVGLSSCAVVIYASSDQTNYNQAWIHHANAGDVSNNDVLNAINAIGNPPINSIVVIFAHPGPHDDGYQDSINIIALAGVAANNIVEIENSNSVFGIDNNGYIGT